MSGTILATSGEGLDGARVELKARLGRLRYRAVCGRPRVGYAFSPVKPGTYDVSVDPPAGYSPPDSQTCGRQRRRGRDRQLRRQPRRDMQGAITDATGAAVEGASVSAAGIDGVTDNGSVLTDESGTYTLDGLRPGAYIVFVHKGGAGAASREATAVGGQTVQADMQIGNPATLTGTVRDATSSDPIQGARIGVGQFRPNIPVATGAGGGFSLADLAPGPETVDLASGPQAQARARHAGGRPDAGHPGRPSTPAASPRP